jgi:NADPH:quinone reductase-like Zn-dependent oxidoreductase
VHDYDAVFDTVAGETHNDLKVLKKGGIIVSVLEPPNTELMNQCGIKAIFRFTQVNRKRPVKLAQWVDQYNNIKTHIDRTFSLNQTGKALDYQKDIHLREMLF